MPQRLKVYRRIADIKTKEDAYDVTDELIDRFGEPPECVNGLIKIALLRNRAAKNNIYEIRRQADKLILLISELDMNMVSILASHFKGRVVVSASGGKPHIAIKLLKEEKQLALLERVFNFIDSANK